MSVRPVLIAPDPRLRQVSTPVAGVTPARQALIRDMFDTMYAEEGIGLAAIQIGVAERIIVMDLEDGEEGEQNRRCFINPEISYRSEEQLPFEEGCLSVPEIRGEIMRPSTIKASWLDEQGKPHKETLTGLLAVCLQHEMDHLEGILFIDHFSRLRRERALAQLLKAAKLAKLPA